MRAEVAEVYRIIGSIKSAASECALGAAELVARLERQGHFDACSDETDWNLVETFVEATATSPHFTNRFGDELEPYKLFVTEARLAFAGALASAKDRRAASDAEDALYESLWGDSADREADERAVARAS